MIYIDPPYNTGKEFIYPDKYSENLATYLAYTGQVDAEGRKFSTNTEAEGRFHSKWMNMMLPRLYLARNLLREDGVILVSIDDHEGENLRRLCNEVFGEENFIANMIWEKGRKNDAKLISIGHEYLLVFAKSLGTLRETKTIWREEKPGAREIWEKYLELRREHGDSSTLIEKQLQAWFAALPKAHPSKKWSRYKRVDSNGPWRDRDISWPGGGGPRYDVPHPKTKMPCKVPERGWIYASFDEMNRQIKLGLVEFRADHTEPPFRKAHIRPITAEIEAEAGGDDDFLDESEKEEFATQVRGSYFYKQSQVAVKFLRTLLGAKAFDNPKDHFELEKLFDYVTANDPDAIIFDFFAGSGSTGHSVMDLNEADGGMRRFILVQLPERLDPEDKDQKVAAKFCEQIGKPCNIAELTKERLRRVIKKLNDEDSGKLDLSDGKKPDRGFRVYKLDRSNFKIWDSEQAAQSPGGLTRQLEMHELHIDPKAEKEDILYELLLKAGFPLTTKVEKVKMAGKVVFSIADGKLLICLERDITKELIKAMAEAAPAQVICLDEGFKANDQLKANAVQTFKARRKGKESEIVFRTV
jgi:adenine-specific DNA-methyltransferase